MAPRCAHAALTTRLTGSLKFQPTIFVRQPVTAVNGLTMHEDYKGRLWLCHGTKAAQRTPPPGARFQYGHFETENLQHLPSGAGAAFADPAALQDISSLFRRLSIYGYHFWQLAEPLQFIGGVTYDHMTFPENFRIAPLSENEESTEQVSPKAGVIWTPGRDTTLRFAYMALCLAQPGPELPIGTIASSGFHPVVSKHHSGIGGRCQCGCSIRNIRSFTRTKVRQQDLLGTQRRNLKLGREANGRGVYASSTTCFPVRPPRTFGLRGTLGHVHT